jgi:hypothetical protein
VLVLRKKVARAFCGVEFHLKEQDVWRKGIKLVVSGQLVPPLGLSQAAWWQGKWLYPDTKVVIDDHLFWNHPHILYQNELYGC